MRLKTKKRLANGGTLAALGAAGACLWLGTHLPPLATEVERRRIAVGDRSADAGPPQASVDPGSDAWKRALRSPLYDPPPPPVHEVVVPPRPITVKLLGTALEPGNNQAFLEQPGGAVELKREGDQATSDPLDGVVALIKENAVVIRRADGEIEIVRE